jgi:adenosylhomocysteine nucleosidase
LVSDARARIGIVVALREERVAVERAVRAVDEAGRTSTLVLQGGLGGAMAAGAARKLLSNAPQMRLLVSCGFSGGLVDSLAVGDIFLASTVTARPSLVEAAQKEEALSCSERLRKRTADAFKAAACPFHEGPLVTLAQPVLRAEEKRSLGEVSHAEAVDMEAAAVARVARESGIEFLALRTISDAVDDALPPEVAAFLDERGRLRTGKVLGFAMRGPGNVKELWRLKSRSDRSASVLGEAVRVALPAWSATVRP